jgi:hypothetical protein
MEGCLGTGVPNGVNMKKLAAGISKFTKLFLKRVPDSQVAAHHSNDAQLQDYEKCARAFTEIIDAHSGLYQLTGLAKSARDSKEVVEMSHAIKDHLDSALNALTVIMNNPGAGAEEKMLLQQILGKLKEFNEKSTDLIDMLQSDLDTAVRCLAAGDAAYQDAHNSLGNLLAMKNNLSDLARYGGSAQLESDQPAQDTGMAARDLPSAC